MLSATIRNLPVLFLLACFLLCLFWSWRWPLVHDGVIMHYVVFLMDHGIAPYRDIIDINMPGTFMLQWMIVHVFGGGPAGWRFFDILTMLVAIGAACWIALPYDWRGGALGSLALALFHLSNGPTQEGQRDWFLMVLVLLGYAFLFHALRTHRPWFMALFAAAMGIAASIKPIAVFFPFILLVAACLILRRRHIALARYVLSAFLGACIPLLASLLFLWRWHAFSAFFTMLRGLLPFYATMGNLPLSALVQMAFGRFLWLLLLVGILLSLLLRTWRHFELNLLALGVLFGAALYVGQGKGWAQHKITLIAFALLWVSIQYYLGLRRKGAARWLGAVSILAICAGAGGIWTRMVPRERYDESALFSLQQDLEALGGPALSGHVQCLEMVSGCINDLYRMRLVQSTGFISDFFVFTHQRIPALEALRARFLSETGARPPKVMVLFASDWASDHVSYRQLDNWPALRDFLQSGYVLYRDQRAADGSLNNHSYRVYLKK
ncbi:MAG: ArnT family glycosyltransferase [Acidobacteriaceae bacterium]